MPSYIENAGHDYAEAMELGGGIRGFLHFTNKPKTPAEHSLINPGKKSKQKTPQAGFVHKRKKRRPSKSRTSESSQEAGDM